MKAISRKNKPSRVLCEGESDWKNHSKLYQSSRLTRREYCRLNNLNYQRFCYWMKKSSDTPVTLLPVKLRDLNDSPLPGKHILCTLNFINGCSLKIHDEQVLSIILENLS